MCTKYSSVPIDVPHTSDRLKDISTTYICILCLSRAVCVCSSIARDRIEESKANIEQNNQVKQSRLASPKLAGYSDNLLTQVHLWLLCMWVTTHTLFICLPYVVGACCYLAFPNEIL